MAITPLTPGGGLLPDYNPIQRLEDQVTLRYAERRVEGQERIENAYQAKFDRIDAESERLISVKASIRTAQNSVTNGREAAETVRQKLLSLRITVDKVATASDPNHFKLEFDRTVAEIARTVDRYSPQYNLVGATTYERDFAPNEVAFKRDTVNEDTLTGTFIGVGYVIEDDDGSVWVPDPSTESIVQYDEYPNGEKLQSTSTRNGLGFVTEPDANGKLSFTLNPDTDNEARFGTLIKAGLELMPSWFYDLETESGRARAEAALDLATSKLTLGEGKLAVQKAIVDQAEARVDERLDRFSAEKSEATRGELLAKLDLDVELKTEFDALVTNLRGASEAQQNYLSIFRNSVRTKNNPFFTTEV